MGGRARRRRARAAARLGGVRRRGAVGAGATAGPPLPGLDVWLDGHVPLGAGLSSSAALECAVGAGARRAGRARAGRLATRAGPGWPHACDRAENEIAGAPTGGMDQAASLRCNAGHALLLDCRDGVGRAGAVRPRRRRPGLLVIDTRAQHALVDGQYGERRATCEEAARDARGEQPARGRRRPTLDAALDRLPDDVSRPPGAARRDRDRAGARDGRAAAAPGGSADVGPVLDASHASLRDDYEVSCPELDLAVETARAAGALGARMTGGGFGGSAIALVPADRAAPRSARAVTAAFAAAGLTAPGIIPAYPAAGAARDR